MLRLIVMGLPSCLVRELAEVREAEMKAMAYAVKVAVLKAIDFGEEGSDKRA